jgi:hypothetical protein
MHSEPKCTQTRRKLYICLILLCYSHKTRKAMLCQPQMFQVSPMCSQLSLDRASRYNDLSLGQLLDILWPAVLTPSHAEPARNETISATFGN